MTGRGGHSPGVWSTSWLAAGAVALGTLTTSCGSAGVAARTAPRYEVKAGSPSGLGRALVDGAGYTLYMFVPDHQGRPTCYSTCAAQWPPLLLPSGTRVPKAGPGAQARLLGTVRRTDGRLQVTYDRWPLYLWFGDVKPGMATGEGLNNLGGYWYALSPDGRFIKK